MLAIGLLGYGLVLMIVRGYGCIGMLGIKPTLREIQTSLSVPISIPQVRLS